MICVHNNYVYNCVEFGKQVVIAISCKSGNKNINLLAFALGESESSELLNSLIKTSIKEAEVPFNTTETVFTSDRGKAITKSIAESAPLAHHLYCGQHLKHNIVAKNNSWHKKIWMYWEARYIIYVSMIYVC